MKQGYQGKTISSLIRVVSLVTVLFFAASANAAIQDLLPRPVINKSTIDLSLQDDVRYNHIVIKFQEGSGIRSSMNQLAVFNQNTSLPNLPAVNWTQITSELDKVKSRLQAFGLPANQLFSVPEQVLTNLKKQGEARTGRQLADLNLYFNVPVPVWMNKQQIEGWLAFLNAMTIVEVAYAVPVTEVASVTATAATSVAPDYEYRQEYLGAAPHGIDAEYAWTLAGGKGENVKIVDIEQGWNVSHEDLPNLFHADGVVRQSSMNHGTAVLGVMSAQDNGYGMTGIVPDAQIGFSSYYQRDDEEQVAAAIINAAEAAGEGGVILLEVHRRGPTQREECSCNTSQCNYIAVEYWDAEYEAIQTAIANGVTVVEAAGNGSVDLDDPVYNGRFDRSVRDSGAILVTGVDSDDHSALCWTNTGSRIDTFAWGENVATLGYGHLFKGDDADDQNQWYTHSFSGSSSATPIVAGAVAAIQSVYFEQTGGWLTPAQIRASIAATGTESSDVTVSGVMPNLAQAIDNALDYQVVVGTCEDYTATISEHVAQNRAYSQSTGWWWVITNTYYVTGSDENMGTDANVQVTLKATDSGYEVGECSDVPNFPVIEDYQIQNSGLSVTAQGSASDPENNLERVVLILESNSGVTEYQCSGTASFQCNVSGLEPGDYVANVKAIDTDGYESQLVGNYAFTAADAGQCVTATNLDHISANRAVSCGNAYFPSACAIGSADNLGYATQWLNSTSSVEEISAGYWIKVNSCP